MPIFRPPAPLVWEDEEVTYGHRTPSHNEIFTSSLASLRRDNSYGKANLFLILG